MGHGWPLPLVPARKLGPARIYPRGAVPALGARGGGRPGMRSGLGIRSGHSRERLNRSHRKHLSRRVCEKKKKETDGAAKRRVPVPVPRAPDPGWGGGRQTARDGRGWGAGARQAKTAGRTRMTTTSCLLCDFKEPGGPWMARAGEAPGMAHLKRPLLSPRPRRPPPGPRSGPGADRRDPRADAEARRLAHSDRPRAA